VYVSTSSTSPDPHDLPTVQVVVGRIGKAHGIRGAVTVEVRTDEPEVRFAVGSVLATEPTAAGPLVVESAKWHAGRLLLHFEGVDDRSGAEALRGTLLSTEVDEQASPADPDEYYDRQLIGLSVRTVDGTDIGTLTDIAHLPSQELLVVTGADRSEVLVPFVEAIVTAVDLEAGVITIDPPGGLLGELS
jgi:16S rRNA processing protein RimM